MIKLPDVTLVVFDTQCHDLTQLAIADCLKHIEPADVMVFTDRPGVRYGRQVDEFTDEDKIRDYSLYKLPSLISTQFIFFIHWDSWVIDPAMWRDEFLSYDYIGAPWWYTDGLNVGNSGFHIRSRALMQHMVDHRLEMPLYSPEDELISRKYRRRLPQFRWAPESVATDFAFERCRPSIESRHFGFHGMFNWPFVMTPDRLAERMALARSNPYIRQSGMLKELDLIFRWRWIKSNYGIKTEELCDVAV
jgi:hypothetical protein